jgi:hypothetical protein
MKKLNSWMMKLWCWIDGHRWLYESWIEIETVYRCERCGCLRALPNPYAGPTNEGWVVCSNEETEKEYKREMQQEEMYFIRKQLLGEKLQRRKRGK